MSGDSGRPILIFDGDCGFCTTAAHWARRRLRHGERVEPWQMLGTEVLAALGLSTRDVEEATWWVDAGGNRWRGHRAAGKVLQASGGWRRGMGWIILLPPTSWLAAGIYRVVVRWRYRLPGATPACRIDKERPGIEG